MLKSLLKDESGQGMAEYGLIIAIAAIAVISLIILIKEGLSAIFHKSGESLAHPENAH
ncbi:MAG TPA: Flp family type IVb pilin [Firmicutes bacterium]|mgnify:CR=1 FL=1|jgi:pilus assembly protein Flp/PilA|nr:Flp family type IVb pilin [Bacillota bacterium]HOQ23113.1 Flp family type IVb pilin [Bacillota bacterium]HPT67010.1 Flp family type IVb pilin [Bacillota bacterium]